MCLFVSIQMLHFQGPLEYEGLDRNTFYRHGLLIYTTSMICYYFYTFRVVECNIFE